MAGTCAGAFHTYTTRNQFIEAALLSEAFALTAPLKLRVADYYLQNGTMPHSNADASLAAPDSIFGTSVKRIALNRGGVLRVDFDEEIGKADMVFTPTASANSGFFSWRCTSDSLPPAVLEKLRPTCNHLPSTNESKLMKAIANNDIAQINNAISAEADVNSVVNGNTPLMLAARVGNSAAVKILIDAGADIDHLGVNSDRRTPLMVAITSNRAEAATILLSRGASVLRTDYQDKSALDHAKDTDARLGGERYELMVSARLNPKFAGHTESATEAVTGTTSKKRLRELYTTLRLAANDCQGPRLRSILTNENEFPADGLIEGKPINLHRSKPQCSAVLTQFVENTAIYEKAFDARLTHAIQSCNDSEVQGLLDEHAEVDVIGPNDRKPSYFKQAVFAGCNAIVSELIREKSLKNELNEGLLVDVIENGVSENLVSLVNTLIEAGVDVNAQSPSGETALVASITASQPVVAKYLIDSGADVNQRSMMGSYPIIEASKKGYQHLVLQLLNAGAEIDRADDLGRTAIIAAVAQGKSRLVDSLMRAGANPHKRDNNGISARILAESSGKRSIQALITATASNQ